MSFILKDKLDKIHLNLVAHQAEPVFNHEDIWNRIIELASLVRTFEPGLPGNIRAFKEAEGDPLDTPFKIYFTDNKENIFIADENVDVELTDALFKHIPEHIVNAELTKIESNNKLNFYNNIDAAIYTAFKNMDIQIGSHNEFDLYGEDNSGKYVYSNPVNVPTSHYMFNPTLSVVSLVVADKYNHDKNNDFLRIIQTRNHIYNIKETLKQDFSELSEEDKISLKETIHKINGRNQTFENKFKHSWIAYANAHHKNANDWTSFLINEVGCDPTLNFSNDTNITPLSLSILKGDSQTLNTLLKHGVSADSYFTSIPNVIDPSKKWFRGFNDTLIPAIVLAAISGSSECVDIIASKTSDVNKITNSGQSAIHFAAQNLDLASLTVLAKHNCNFELEDYNGRIAAEKIEQTPEGDAIYQIIEDWRVGDKPRPTLEESNSIILRKEIDFSKLKESKNNINTHNISKKPKM